MPLLEDSLVVLYKPGSQECAGAGVLVGPDLVLTCAHVVNLACGRDIEATGRPEGEISLRLYSSRSFTCTAAVASGEEAWSDPPPSRGEGADLCLLHLSRSTPSDVSPALLYARDDLINCKFRAVGFPEDYRGDMDVARGEIVARDQYGLYLLQPESGALPGVVAAAKGGPLGSEHRIAGEIHRGFSGGPVEVEAKIVGLITASRRPSEATSYMIPVRAFPKCIARETRDEPGKPALTILRINDVARQESDLSPALTLYRKRLPESERYDVGDFINLLRRHLSGDFGPHRPSAYWKAYLFVAKYGQEVVGMLLGYGYNDSRSNFLYIPYLISRKPQKNKANPYDVSRALVRGLIQAQPKREDKGPQPRFLTEVDDPEEATDPGEKRKRRARIELFDQIAGFAKMQLRCLDFKFLQPKLIPGSSEPETRLRILYGVDDPPSTLPKTELAAIITWLYTQLYAANISEDPAEGQEYRRYLDQLLKNALETLPDEVRLLRPQKV